MALTLRTQVTSSITDAATGISISQQQTFTDTSCGSLNLNFMMGTYSLACCSDWVQVDTGDMGPLREIYIALTSSPLTQGIGVIITCDDPNSLCLDPTFNMRETFVATTCIPATDNLYLKNLGCCAASLTVIVGGENA